MARAERTEKIKIRAFRAGDEVEIGKMMAKAMRRKKFSLLSMDKPPGKKKLREWRKANLSGKSHTFIAEADGRIIGDFTFNLGSGRTRRRAACGWSVHPDYWQRGIASLLLKRAIQKAKKLNLKRLEAEIVVKNTASIKLAEKFGFKREGVKKKAFISDSGKYLDTYVYGRLL